MKNPVYQVISSGKPFVYFHTLLFNKNIMNLAKRAGKSLEIDISMDKYGALFIGHPLEFYEFKHMMPPPQNLPLEIIIDESKEADLFLVLDCKDVRAIPATQSIIGDYGVQNTLFHSWLIELQFAPYAPEIEFEPHWIYEDLPLKDILKLKAATGVPVISSARGLTTQRLINEPEIVDKIIKVAAGKVEAINFNLPNNAAPPKSVIQKLLDNNLLTYFNIDRVPAEDLPDVYVGISDHFQNVTNQKDFQD
jgi:hypothetical protein